MKKLAIIIIALMAIISVSKAQTFELPDYQFKTAEDYTTYASDFVKATAWFESKAPNEEATKRQAVSAFLMKWMSGTPTVTLEIKAEIATFMESPELFMLYLAGWSRYSIENDSKDQVKGCIAGLETVMKYYSQFKDKIGKNKPVEKYLKLQSKGKLESFVQKNL